MPTERSRLRLIVVRVLVFSLFATLFARLYYLQVVSGDSYRAGGGQPVVARGRGPAAARADRRRPGPAAGRQPHRVGGVRRPDPARQALRRTAARSSWTGWPARSTPRRSRSSGRWSRAATRAASAGSAGTARRTSRSRSPRRSASRSRCGSSSSPRTTPAVVAQQQSVRAYPQPYGVNLADIVGYLSPITAGELTQAKKDHDTSVNGASHRRPRRASRRSTTATCVAGPATRRSRWTRWVGCSVTRVRSRATPETRWSRRSTRGCRPRPRRRCTTRSRPRARRTTR